MPADGTRQQRALATSRRWLDVVASGVPSRQAQALISSETLANFATYVNRGFLQYRKAATEAADHAAIEWEGRGSIVRDLSGREVIDCLGGFGVYSAGIKHPKIVAAVAHQLARMPLSSQELLDPLRGALAALPRVRQPGRRLRRGGRPLSPRGPGGGNAAERAHAAPRAGAEHPDAVARPRARGPRGHPL
jgi:putrescine aminotransferase